MGCCRRRRAHPTARHTTDALARTRAADRHREARARPDLPRRRCRTDSAGRSAMRCARRSMVGASNNARSGRSIPSRDRMRETSRVASSECPPSSKNESVTPMAERWSTSLQQASRSRSMAVRGGTCSRTRRAGTAGAAAAAARARRSTLPLCVNGSASSQTMASGTMCGGSARARCARRSSSSDGTVASALAGCTRVPGDAGNETPARAIARSQNYRLTHGGMHGQGGLDLAQLDPVAADLDLVVERARGTRSRRPRDTARGRRCDRGARRARRLKGCGAKRSAVSSGRRQ